MNSDPLVSLKLLGNPAISEGHGGPLLTGRVTQRHRIALLALLTRSAQRGLSREKAMAYLWPENDPEHARNLLNVSVYVLRRALGEDALISSGDDLRLNTQVVKADVTEFEAAVMRADHEHAAALYEGPFLDGFFLSHAPEFERWAERERERLAASYAKTLEALARAAETRRDFEAAAECWKARAAHDPYDSRVARCLIHALEAGGNPAAALQHAELHARRLREEFGVEPDPETQAVVDAIRQRRASHDRIPAHAADDRDGQPAHAAIASSSSRAGSEPFAPRSMRERSAHKRWMSWGGGVVVVTLALWGLIRLASSFGFDRPDLAFAGASADDTARGDRPAAYPTADGRPPHGRSIAVLPFMNMSPDSGEEYFSDGLAEELIGTLARIDALRVVARTSSFAFKGENRDVREIGEALSVATVLEGSLRRDGDRLIVSAQLINVSDGFHLWSETYERRFTDIFDIQRDLALQIAEALEAELTPAERDRLARRPTDEPDAHIPYLKGRYFLGKRTATSLATAIEYFERAIAADPLYAQAHAGLATTYASFGVHGYIPAAEARERMRQAAVRAIEIDPDLAEARTALAGYRHLHEWDWASAERELRRAIALDPNYPTAHTWYGYLFESMGRFENAVAELTISLELDPLAASAYSALGFALFLAGQADRGLEHIGQAIELDPTNWMAHIQLGQVREALGNLDAAIAAYENAVSHSRAAAKPRAALARALALSGWEDEASPMLASLVAEANATGAHAPVVATVFLALGDVDGAIAWLENAYLERQPDLQRITADPRFAGLRDDPRFLDLLDRIGLPH